MKSSLKNKSFARTDKITRTCEKLSSFEKVEKIEFWINFPWGNCIFILLCGGEKPAGSIVSKFFF